MMWSELRDVSVVGLCLCLEGRQGSREDRDERNKPKEPILA